MTFGKPIRKRAGFTAKRRAAKHRRLKREENGNKAEARARDGKLHGQPSGRCRFPLCGCRKGWSPVIPGTKSFVEVSHQQHKGMGGDPTGERSAPELLMCLCAWRHKEAPFSIDKKTLRWVPLTDAGANGPVKWEAYQPHMPIPWFELARESAVQVLEPPDILGEAFLRTLALMQS